jgi:hypothetical protein
MEKLKMWLFWNGSLGLLHSQAPPLMIASMINIESESTRKCESESA